MLPPRPQDLSVELLEGVVWLRWTPADPAAGWHRPRILRRLNQPPSGPDDPDAAVIAGIAAGSASDSIRALLPDVPRLHQGESTARVYFYTVFGCTDEGRCDPGGSTASLRPTLTDALRGGGYVLHLRHASADVCGDRFLGTAANPVLADWWRSCDDVCVTAPARQISAVGRAEAVLLGEVFRGRGFAFDRVLSSEFCRNFTTADLMSLGPPTELLPAITYWVYDELERCTDSYALLSEMPSDGTNRVLVGHAGFPAPCPVLDELAWAETAIFKPDGAGGTVHIARVLVHEWPLVP